MADKLEMTAVDDADIYLAAMKYRYEFKDQPSQGSVNLQGQISNSKFKIQNST
jgi:hypothetical protein